MQRKQICKILVNDNNNRNRNKETNKQKIKQISSPENDCTSTCSILYSTFRATFFLGLETASNYF